MSTSASPFLYVGGVPLKVTDWRERRIQIGDIRDKSLSGRPAVSRSGTIREWTCKVPRNFASTFAERMAWVAWIEGRGQKWNFDSATSSYSAAGATATVAGSYTRSGTGGDTGFGGRITIASGSLFGVDMYNKLGLKSGWSPLTGFTSLFKRKFVAGDGGGGGTGWKWVGLTGAVAYTRASAANPGGITQYLNGAPSNTQVGHYTQIQSSGDFCALYGYENDNNAADIEYDDWLFVPFQMSAAWIAAIYANLINGAATSKALPKLPRQKIWGEWFAAPEVDGVEVIGYVNQVSQAVGALGGATWAANLAELELTFEEW